MPTLPRVYEVAKLGEDNEETWNRSPFGIPKSSKSGAISQTKQSGCLEEGTSGRSCQRSVGIISVPSGGFIKCVLDIFHEPKHIVIDCDSYAIYLAFP